MKCIDCQNAEMCLDHKEQPSLIGCTSGIPERKKQTNADRIRSMSDEELAEFLADSEKFSPCNNCDFHFVDAMNDDCKAPDGWICTKGYAAALIQKWLQSEVEE